VEIAEDHLLILCEGVFRPALNAHGYSVRVEAHPEIREAALGLLEAWDGSPEQIKKVNSLVLGCAFS